MTFRFAIQTYQDALQTVLDNRVVSLLTGRIPRAEPASESAAFLIGEILKDHQPPTRSSHWVERTRAILERAKELAPDDNGHDLDLKAIAVWPADHPTYATGNVLSQGILEYLAG